MKKHFLKQTFIAILLLITLTGCSLFGNSGNDNFIPTTIPIAPPDREGTENSPTPVTENIPTREGAFSPTPMTGNATDKPAPTKEAPTSIPTSTDIPTPEVSPSPTMIPPQTEEKMTAEEAREKLEFTVGVEYQVSQPENIVINGKHYYLFTVSDEHRIYSPSIIISADNRQVYWFFSVDEITELTSFPLDNAEAGQTPEGSFTGEDAVRLLETFTAEELALPEKISEYIISVDDWPTMIRGEECYGINAYADLGERKQLMGVFYVTMDGSSVYRNEMEEFILIH